jgi:hypothetical protein
MNRTLKEITDLLDSLESAGPADQHIQLALVSLHYQRLTSAKNQLVLAKLKGDDNADLVTATGLLDAYMEAHPSLWHRVLRSWRSK